MRKQLEWQPIRFTLDPTRFASFQTTGRNLIDKSSEAPALALPQQ